MFLSDEVVESRNGVWERVSGIEIPALYMVSPGELVLDWVSGVAFFGTAHEGIYLDGVGVDSGGILGVGLSEEGFDCPHEIVARFLASKKSAGSPSRSPKPSQPVKPTINVRQRSRLTE